MGELSKYLDSDLALVLGVVIGLLSIPSILSAMTDGRAPRASAVTILIAGLLIIFAIQTHPGGYSIGDVPNAFVVVVARFMP
ncbi:MULTISPECIES: hypothetical protein [Roseobacteraceae]|jgi:hypothetical protein|uniref:50S ribosomal protein L35 n=1 Tax=Pseudosulfitobacter pseudonitzschiae TaxID=1402135 RepID=A0A221K5N9_9RHOB|nr:MULTISPECIES: hypothetical protein [Roseobacteraceae]ASM74275.1 50S ribosomal protein L35 [Pseudosulfitobacter pseudonitzschiae]